MANMSQTNVPDQDTKEQHLSVDLKRENVSLALPRGRSSSVSAQTIVAENPDIEARKAAIKRRGTHVAVVKLSWWDCIKAAFTGPKNLKRQLAATVEWAEAEEIDERFFDDRENPYTLSVSVYPREGAEFIQARCVLDTGCAQGNIISASLAHRLGFTDADFQPLTPREDNGGLVATGEIHKVSGAIRLSWFHSTSTKVFTQMRFLVSDSAHVDLVIGTRSIVKENLLTPPNLGVDPDTQFNDLQAESDRDRENLAGDIAQLEADVRKAKKALSKTTAGTKEHSAAEKSLKKKEEALQVAKWKLELYDVDARLSRKNTDKTARALMDMKKGLEAKLASKEKKRK